MPLRLLNGFVALLACVSIFFKGMYRYGELIGFLVLCALTIVMTSVAANKEDEVVKLKREHVEYITQQNLKIHQLQVQLALASSSRQRP